MSLTQEQGGIEVTVFDRSSNPPDFIRVVYFREIFQGRSVRRNRRRLPIVPV
jgi:hypothetical protein